MIVEREFREDRNTLVLPNVEECSKFMLSPDGINESSLPHSNPFNEKRLTTKSKTDTANARVLSKRRFIGVVMCVIN